MLGSTAPTRSPVRRAASASGNLSEPRSDSAGARQTWKPEKPVEFIVQSAAGGGSDIFARTMAKILADEKIVTTPINVVNPAVLQKR